MKNPSKTELNFNNRKNESYNIKYIVTKPDEYLISIKFNDKHIPKSPFKIYITPNIKNTRKLSVTTLQQKKLQINIKIKKNKKTYINTQLFYK